MVSAARFATFAVATLVSLASVLTPAVAAESTPSTPPVVQLIQSPTPTEVPVQAAIVDDVEEEFATLDAAVAAQDRAVADEATRCLASAIYFESKGEPLSGQLAVAQVIINRAKSGRFPDDVCSVVTQRGQFGFVRGGRIPAIDEDRAGFRTAVAVARVALADAWDGAAETALYFNTPNRVPAPRLQRVAVIGHHVFYR